MKTALCSGRHDRIESYIVKGSPTINLWCRVSTRRFRASSLLLAFAIICMAILLRPSMAAIGPLLDLIQAEIPLTNTGASLLTALPMAMIGVGALAGRRLRARIREHWGILAGAALITLMTAARDLWWSPTGLILTAIMTGVGIAMVQVLIPSFVKRHFYGHSAQVMGLYTTGIMAGAAAGSATAPWLADQLGWSRGLAIWWTFGVATSVLWLAAYGYRRMQYRANPEAIEAVLARADDERTRSTQNIVDTDYGHISLITNLRAWELLVFFGICTGAFTLLLAWLPPYYTALGWPISEAGYLLGVYTTAEVGIGLLLSAVIAYFPDRRGPIFIALALLLIGLILLIFTPMWSPLGIAAILGAGTGALFSLSLILAMDHAPDAAFAGRLADFVQGGGYFIAASTPLLAGILRDQFSDLRGAWAIMLLGTLLLIAMATRFSPTTYHRLLDTSAPKSEG